MLASRRAAAAAKSRQALASGPIGGTDRGVRRPAGHVAFQLRALDIPVKSVREKGGKPLAGCEREAVAAHLSGAGL